MISETLIRRVSRVFAPAAGLCLAVLTGSPASAQTTNLLQNGSFESSSGGNEQLIGSGAVVTGWSWAPDPASSPSPTALVSAGYSPQDGAYALSFGFAASGSGGAIAQNFTAVPGVRYSAKFWVRRNGNSLRALGASAVILDGAGNTVANVSVSSSAISAAWKGIAFEFTAPAAALRFVFTDTTLQGQAPDADLLLDNVSIVTAAARAKADIVAASQRAVNFIINDTKRLNSDNCFSCHNSGQAVRAGLMAERSPDLSVDQTQLNRLVTYINQQQYTVPNQFRTGAISHVGNANYVAAHPNTTSTWALYSLIGAEQGTTATPYSQERFLLGAGHLERLINQYGYVPGDHIAPPVDSNNPGETARAVAVLARARQIDNAAHWTTAIDRGIAFLRNTTPRNSADYFIQDAAWIVLGLSAAGVTADDPKISTLVALLKSRRNTADGGWSRYTTQSGTILPSDAFATGVVLNALLAIGEKNSASYPEMQSGIQFLLGTQQPDGGWASNISRVSGSTWAVLSLTELAAAPPTLTVPADIIAEATGPTGAAVSFSVTASDEVDGALTPTVTPASGSTFALGATKVTATATNSSGNTATKSFNVTVVDTTKPVITVPANISLEATSSAGAVATFSYSAVDSVSGQVAATSTHASGSTFPIGTTVVTVSATDGAGNTGSAIFAVFVKDTTPPVIDSHPNLVREATGPAGAVVTFAPSATDVASPLTVSASPASGSTFALGDTTVTVTAQDSRGNSASSTFTVTVRDTTAPVIAALSDITAEAASPAGAVVTFAGSATDAVTANVALTASPASGSTFALGTTTVTLTATDAAGNQSTATFKVTVRDTIKPELTVPASQTVEATGPSGAVVNFAASATDATGVTLTYSSAPGSTFALGTTTVSVTARDGAGNETSGSFTITVRDTTKPVLTLPSDLTLEATQPGGAVGSFSISAADLVTPNPAVSVSHASGTVFPLGTTTVLVSATDAAGNKAAGSFSVTVRDTTAPVVTAPANQVLEATSAAGAPATFSASATDAVGVTSVTYSPASGSTFRLGTTPVVVTAQDAAANSGSASFTITVRDTTAPTIDGLAASTGVLWPANHKMVAISLAGSANDAVGVRSFKIVKVTSNEPDNGLGDGDTPGDIVITGDRTLNLRAERGGSGDGRVYTIVVEARDAADNVTTATVTVAVPKSQGRTR